MGTIIAVLLFVGFIDWKASKRLSVKQYAAWTWFFECWMMGAAAYNLATAHYVIAALQVLAVLSWEFSRQNKRKQAQRAK